MQLVITPGRLAGRLPGGHWQYCRSWTLLSLYRRRCAPARPQGILNEADGIIISRGNLGLDCVPEKMALVQKTLVQVGRQGGGGGKLMLRSGAAGNGPVRRAAAGGWGWELGRKGS